MKTKTVSPKDFPFFQNLLERIEILADSFYEKKELKSIKASSCRIKRELVIIL